ncbi:MAG TPA: hypothetical protein DIV79_11095 [Opitutae bacterium]|nr:hypothetical protein [Opitutaceae bacterium]HCR30552.1 hypothetical protein [Opitutae bacterium]
MAEEKKTAKKSTSKPEKKKGSADAAPKVESNSSSQNGKGDGPRNIFSEEFRSNYDSIDWGR